jgi:hypothetical protein
MEVENELSLFDVVSMEKGKSPLSATTFKVIEATLSIANRIKLDGYGRNGLDAETIKDWGYRGLDCQVLQAGSEGWRKGKIRLSLFFVPDEPEEDDEEIHEIEESKCLCSDDAFRNL